MANLGNLPLVVALVVVTFDSFRDHRSDVVFAALVGLVPLLAVWASVRLLTFETRERIGPEAVHLAAVAGCCVVNFFAGGFVGLGGNSGGAYAFLLAVALQATAFVLTLLVLLRRLSTRVTGRGVDP